MTQKETQTPSEKEPKTKNRFFTSVERKRITIMVVLITIVVLAAITVTIVFPPVRVSKGKTSDKPIQFRPAEMTVEGGKVDIVYSVQRQ